MTSHTVKTSKDEQFLSCEMDNPQPIPKFSIIFENMGAVQRLDGDGLNFFKFIHWNSSITVIELTWIEKSSA